MITIKNEKELELMRISSRIVAETFEYIASFIRPGITTAEIDRRVEKFIKGKGGYPAFKGLYGFPASACISIDDEVVHGIPSSRRIVEEGMLVKIDVGVRYKGYHGDAAYTYLIGDVGEEKRRLVRVTWEALWKGIEQAKAGNRLQDISATIQQYVEAHGYSVVRELVGHGIGRDLHEDPQVPNYGKHGKGPRLRSGFTLAIEPMVNAGTKNVRTLADGWTVVTADGKPSAHYEHTVVIRDGEPEILTVHHLNPIEE
ncbi:MAG: type I methionyl aminopeptidase [Calditrichaeota bacterium]|nr:MAG: type I methionyl aminopeptidase [Calditrichota bacterium]